MVVSGEVDRAAIREAVYTAIDRLNEQLPPEESVEREPEAKLYGEGAPLDSLGLVNLIVLTEEAVRERLGRSVALGDQALDEDENPFADVATLVDRLVELLEEPGP